MEDKRVYNNKASVIDDICSHCGKTHDWDEDTCAVYDGKYICAECYQNYYGTCNGCGKLNKYTDMNADIICTKCILSSHIKENAK